MSKNYFHVEKSLTIAKRDMVDGNLHCFYCGIKVVQGSGRNSNLRTLDHVVPESQGGSDQPNNLITACMRCNIVRNDMYILDWLLIVADNPLAKYKQLLAQLAKPIDKQLKEKLYLLRKNKGVKAAREFFAKL